MPSKKLTKDEVRSPDFFQSHGTQFAEWMLKHQSVVVSILVLAVLAGLGWLGVNRWQLHREVVANQALYPVEKAIRTDLEKTKAVGPAATTDYEKALADNSGANASIASLISITPDMLKVGKAEQLSHWFQILKVQPLKDDIQFGLLKMTEGMVALENHRPDDALAMYSEVLSADGQKAFHSEALLKSAVAYEMKNDMKKARETLEKVRTDHPTSQAGELALQYILYLDQKSQPTGTSGSGT